MSRDGTKPFTCPVCGYDDLPAPARDDEGVGLLEFCPCCRFQFGVTDDDKDWTDEAWRAEWIVAGMPWRSYGQLEPASYDPRSQIEALLRGDR